MRRFHDNEQGMVQNTGMVIEGHSTLENEIDFYFSRKIEWLKEHSESYVVIQGVTVLGFYRSFEAVFREGVRAFGVKENFLVRQVLEKEPVFFVF